jgi:UDP-glucose 4-epimerase
MKVLVTGGAGFIGATIVSACLDAGHEPVVVDDFSTGARAFVRDRCCYEGDVADPALLARIVDEHPDLAAVVHCAAHIVVPESVADPLRYYDNNVSRTVALLRHLNALGISRVLFSSSAAMYAPGADFTVDENSALDPGSPYAATKAVIERVLADACAAGLFGALSLRYFNPVGADPQLRTGLQLPRPSHALGKLIEAYETGVPFVVTGVDWPTRDGSGIRDYIHVWDLARAHVRALERFDDIVRTSRYDVINLGTGSGTTVRELVAAFEEVTGSALPVTDGPARPGDVVGSYTRVDKARAVLGWEAERTVVDGIRDALAWAAIRAERLTVG